MLEAVNFAAAKHEGQLRKAERVPYIVHPFSVAWILSGYDVPEDVIIAGLLHDVLEDVAEVTPEEIRQRFGEHVLSIVLQVTEKKDPRRQDAAKETWHERKTLYLERLRTASREAMLVSAADKLHNIKSITLSHKKLGDAVWTHFNAPREKILWYYGEVVKLLESRLDHPLIQELRNAYSALA